MGSGSGLCAIAAMRAGALAATAVDVDPFAAAAIRINARVNRVRIDVSDADILDDEPPDVDLILAGDCWYEERLASRVTTWLQRANAKGIDVLLGDPGRRYLPVDTVIELASYEVRSTSEMEDLGRTRAWVHKLRTRADTA
jgi:predicted nicotinamide N-methyase